MGLISGYPLWLIIVCIALGAAYAAVLYTGKKSKKWRPGIRTFLFSLRFVVVTLLAFFLLEPLIRLNVKVTNNPVLIVASDNSRSMTASADSDFVRNKLPGLLNDWLGKMENNLEIARYHFSDSLHAGPQADYNGGLTDIGNVFDEIRNRYINKNVAGIVLISDGIYNTGMNPLTAAEQIQAPVFTVSVGDTSIHTDAAITSLTGNREVVFNNYFPVEFSVSALQAAGQSMQVKVTHNEKDIFNSRLDISGNQFSRVFNIRGFADKKGLNKIVVSVSVLKGEKNITNNSRVFYFNVADEEKKVLIVASAPHPDVRAIRTSLESNLNYSVKTITGEANAGDISGYDLLILHQIPSAVTRNSALIEKAKTARIPVWMITGSNTNYALLNALNAGVTVRVRSAAANEVLGVVNENFALFSIPQQEADFVKTMPPLTAAFGDYGVTAGTDVLMYQRVGNVITSQPLLCMSQVQGQRWAFLLGEGIWRWKLYDFQRNRSHELFDSFMSRIAQFLCQNSDRSRFRVIYEPTHSETEAITFNAELFNQNFELINSEPIDLILRDSVGKNFACSFLPDGSGYSLNCGRLRPGEYSFTAQVKSKQYPYTQSGKITVDSYNPELASTRADFNMMKLIAQQTGGIMVSPDKLNDISDFLEKNNLIQSTYYRENKYIDLLEWKWILFIILALVTTEWVIRKREGYY